MIKIPFSIEEIAIIPTFFYVILTTFTMLNNTLPQKEEFILFFFETIFIGTGILIISVIVLFLIRKTFKIKFKKNIQSD